MWSTRRGRDGGSRPAKEHGADIISERIERRRLEMHEEILELLADRNTLLRGRIPSHLAARLETIEAFLTSRQQTRPW